MFKNLWQHDLIGLKAEVYFGVARLAVTAFAKVTNVAMGLGFGYRRLDRGSDP